MNSLKVLSEFGFEVDECSFSTGSSHITDKMVVDLINGIEVTNDHIKVSKSRVSKKCRFFDAISGKSAQRQNLINENLANGLECAGKWLQKHDYELGSINVAITKIGTKLIETRQGVMALQSKHERLATSVHQLANIVEVKNKELVNYVRDVDYRVRAEKQLDRIFDKWSAGRLNHLEIYPRVYSVLDILRNNDFGFYLTQGSAEENYKKAMLENLHDKLKIQFCDDLNIATTDFMSNGFRMKTFDMYDDIGCLEKIDLFSLNYLSDWGDDIFHSNNSCFNKLTEAHINGDKQSCLSQFPKTFRVDRWLNRLTSECFSSERTIS